jgi:hypothetical protein
MSLAITFVSSYEKQPGFQLTVSHQASTINNRADRMSRITMSKSFQGYQKKMVWKKTEYPEQIRGPQSSVVICSQ